MCTLKILTDLCFTKQKIKRKNGFVKVVYSAWVKVPQDLQACFDWPAFRTKYFR